VIAAAVLVRPDTPVLEGVNDSKQLTARRRDDLAAAIVSGLACAVGAASTREIDRLNIRRATALAMRRALERLGRREAADLVLVEANPLADIRNTRRISAVVVRGKLHQRRELDALLAAIRAMPDLRVNDWVR